MIKYKVLAYYHDYYRGKVRICKTVWTDNIFQAKSIAREYFGNKYYGKDVYIYDVVWR